jgi:hypothetical protein
MGLDPNMLKSDNNQTSVRVAKYELTYSGDLLVKIAHNRRLTWHYWIISKTMEEKTKYVTGIEMEN